MAVTTNESNLPHLIKKQTPTHVVLNTMDSGVTRAESSCTYVRLNSKAPTWTGVSTGVDYREIRIPPVEV